MLPQMMPLPWLMVFFMIFFCVYSSFLYVSVFPVSLSHSPTKIKSSCSELPW